MDITLKWPDDIPETQFNQDFLQGMVDRMAMSYFKYGDMRKLKPGMYQYRPSVETRIEKYEETGNTEWLMDASNFLMIEFTTPAHPEAHYRGTDSDESPGWSAYNQMTTKHKNVAEADEVVARTLRNRRASQEKTNGS